MAIHRCAQIRIFQVGSEELGVFDGEHAIDEEFGRCEVSGFGTNVERIVNLVATTSCPADAAGISFLGRNAKTTRKYVALRPFGMSVTRMKCIVLVPLMEPWPLTKQPISSAFDACQR